MRKKKMKEEFPNIPFQVENLIKNMMDKNERPHIRDNYRSRLEYIKTAIDQSIRKYDNDAMMHGGGKKRA